MLSKAELEILCTTTASNHPLLSTKKVGSEIMYIPKWLQFFNNIVGIYGNADPEDIAQWLTISSPFGSNAVVKSRVWIPSESRCEGIPTRLRYHFLWTYVGSTSNPQAKIIRYLIAFHYKFLYQSKMILDFSIYLQCQSRL